MPHWKTLLDSEVLRFVDIEKDYTLQIKKIQKGKVTGDGGKKNGKGLIWFHGAEKPMAAGSGVLSTIENLYGSNYAEWIDKWITIYPDPSVMYGKERKGGVRVRPVIPKQAQQGKPASKANEPIDLNEALLIQQQEAEENRRG